MRVVGSRNKKLIVAFHFHFTKPAAWKCDTCRSSGLERARGCRFGGYEESNRPVWARRSTITRSCPKSIITPQSSSWLDAFFAWKMGGSRELIDLAARTADAFMVLEREWRLELQNAEQ